MRYEWDKAKARSNLTKHGVDFRDAIEALEDPQRLEMPDVRRDYGEDRTITIGGARGIILLIVTAERGEFLIRIISARKAMTHEQRRYFEADDGNWW